MKKFLAIGMATLVTWVILYAISVIKWMVEGPHIEALIRNEIPMRFDDIVLYGMVHLEWWAVAGSAVLALMIVLSIIYGKDS